MEKLKFIKEHLTAIGIPYEFGEWSDADIPNTYFVGEITPEPITTEDGSNQSVFLLTGFHRGKFITLFEYAEQIERLFHPIYGLRGRTDSGAIAVFYSNTLPIPSGEMDLKKIEIRLTVKEWKRGI